MVNSIAIIGSFRQHNEIIQSLCAKIRRTGIAVNSPQGIDVIQSGVDFVRFHADNPDWSDATVQSLALHRILRSDLVYAVLPDGYIGRTTCYEVGRVIQASRPIYFSNQPKDLPLHVPDSFVMDEAILLKNLMNPSWQPDWIYSKDKGQTSDLERELIKGVLRNE